MSKWMSTLAFVGILGVGIAAFGVTKPPFDEVDKDEDGLISRAEAAKVENLDFTKADANKDGMLDRSEYESATS